MMNTAAGNGHMFANYPGAFDYATAPPSHLESLSNTPEKVCGIKQAQKKTMNFSIDEFPNFSNRIIIQETNVKTVHKTMEITMQAIHRPINQTFIEVIQREIHPQWLQHYRHHH